MLESSNNKSFFSTLLSIAKYPAEYPTGNKLIIFVCCKPDVVVCCASEVADVASFSSFLIIAVPESFASSIPKIDNFVSTLPSPNLSGNVE